MKHYRVFFSGSIEVQSKNESQAAEMIEQMSNAEIGAGVEEIDGVREIE